jgi:hypothetical protein
VEEIAFVSGVFVVLNEQVPRISDGLICKNSGFGNIIGGVSFWGEFFVEKISVEV